jgi:hypothetical protein
MQISNLLIILLLCMLSGAFDGLAETLKWHYSQFNERFANANPAFWNPAISWTNKYKNGDYHQGEKFWQSSRAFVFTTDGYHLSRMFRNVFIISAIAFHISQPILFWQSSILFASAYFTYTIGFSVVYDLLFKRSTSLTPNPKN